ncbi:MAG: heme-binding protein [Acidobacteriia bacterium]|nr:heme-binding protein [Terriglobia bacterium]
MRLVCLAGCLLAPYAALADSDRGGRDACKSLPTFSAVQSALTSVVAGGGNSGLGFNMWATVVNRDGVVCLVTFSGTDRGSQWPGSRVISAQKANTANAFSLPGFALSTANLYSAVQPGGSLFGLQESNPVDTGVAYGGNSTNYGQPNDPMVGQKIGGVNVFGGGLALYDKTGALVGAIGVSGDTSCTDHVIAWKVRHALNFDDVPAGVAPGAPKGTDNIIFDINPDAHGHPVSTSTFGHPACSTDVVTIGNKLVTDFPVGPNP